MRPRLDPKEFHLKFIQPRIQPLLNSTKKVIRMDESLGDQKNEFIASRSIQQSGSTWIEDPYPWIAFALHFYCMDQTIRLVTVEIFTGFSCIQRMLTESAQG